MKKWVTKSGCKIVRILSGRSNVFLLTNGEKNILVDTSISLSWSKLQRRFERLNIKTIDYLILTHSHFDHTANANRIKEKYKSTVVIHMNDAPQLSKGETVIPRGAVIFTTLLVNTVSRLIPNSLFRYDPCVPDIIVNSDIYLNNPGFNLFLMHTPGHTFGSMSLIIDDEIAIVGDTMFGVFSWSVYPPFADDCEMMIKSWKKLLETNCYIFLPSHGSANKRSLVEKKFKNEYKKPEPAGVHGKN